MLLVGTTGRLEMTGLDCPIVTTCQGDGKWSLKLWVTQCTPKTTKCNGSDASHLQHITQFFAGPKGKLLEPAPPSNAYEPGTIARLSQVMTKGMICTGDVMCKA